MPIRAACIIVVVLFATSATRAAPSRGSCEQIADVCRSAGFVQGGVAEGNGVLADCVEPIVQGTAQRRKASKPLPQVDPQLVAACKTDDPGLARRQAFKAADKADQTAPAAASLKTPSPLAHSAASGRPNIVFVLTDDLSWNLVQFMPHVLKMQKDGVTFTNYFVTDSLCCPSRSSIFTGRYPHDTGIYRNTGNDGGFVAFRNRGHEQSTFAASLAAAGYRTAMLGKYLNGYLPAKHPPAPGWTMWAVAGNGYPEFNYNLNQDGRIVRFADKPSDYLTDVLSSLAVRFIEQPAGSPFLIEIATFAPHAPYTPAPRDADALPGLRAPRTPAFGAAPDANAARWLLAHPPLSDADIGNIERGFRKRAQSVLAVDKMIGELQAAVAAIDETNNTYFIFSSDNGYHMGEHRLLPGKMTAYDTDIRVPLIVTGPGVPAGVTIDEIVENVDLCPTFNELGGAATAANVDGRSLVSLMHGQPAIEWRTVALVEHRGPDNDQTDPDLPAARSGNPTTYEAIRARSSVYVEYDTGEKEYHDLVADPNELLNSFALIPAGQKASLHATLNAVKNCHDAKTCLAAERGSGSAPRK